MAEIKHSYSKALELLTTIQGKEIEEKANEKFNRAAETSKKQVEQQLQQLLQKINPEGKANNLSEAKEYASESLHILVTNINSFRKNIAYTSFYLKEEMSQLGEKLQELITALQEINGVFEKEKLLFEFEEFKEKSKHKHSKN